MHYDLAKRNRLNGKFNFKQRDWQFELDGSDDDSPLPLENERPRKPKIVWQRDAKQRRLESYDKQDAG